MDKNFKPPLTRPEDFSAFWRETRRQLTQVEPATTRTQIPHEQEPDLVLEEVSFRSLGEVRVHGYLLYSASNGGRPLVVHSHGYMSRCEVQWDWARAGINVIGVDIRGCGRSEKALPGRSPRGYVLSGIDDPQTSVLRGAVCDYIRAVEVGQEILGLGCPRTVLQGFSFAGSLALMAEALLQSADFLAVGVPTFGWAEGRRTLAGAGSAGEINRYLAEHRDQTKGLMRTLSYFDPINFAGLVRCPTLVGVGLRDEIVPAQTVYSIANHLIAPHQVMEYPVSHTALPEERLWKDFESHWLDVACKGVPAEFGGRPAAR